MKETKIMLEGLDCAHCASKIEAIIKNQDFVQEATLNFVGKYVNIEYKDKKEDEVLEIVRKIVNKLEPDVKVELSVSENTDDSKKDLIRIIIAAILFIPAVVFESQKLLSMILSIAAYIIIGYDIVLRAVKNIFQGQVFDENFLMVVASLGALIIGEYPEAAGVMLFYQLGEFVQSIAVNKSRKQIKSLLNIKPEFANIKTETGIKKVKPEAVNINDLIIVKPGEKIPLDGVIIEGSSFIDTSCLTGESMPVDKTEGEEVLSGSINQTGVLTIKATKLFKESTVSKILFLVEKASNKKSETENFITKFARYYTPIVVLLAALIAVIPSIIFKDTIWVYRGLIFLVVSCPCALVLSIPLTYFSGLGCASKFGILIKGGNYLEALSNAEIAVFDKTGTLTEGKFTVSEINTFNNYTENELLSIAAHGEYYSNHPIANSIKDKFTEKINVDNIKDYTEIAGYGVKATINGKLTLLGNDKLMALENITYQKAVDKPGTVLYIAQENTFIGYIVISDIIKKDAQDLVQKLKAVGIKRAIMLTGDNNVTANYVKKQIGLDEVYSGLLPADKVNKVEELIKNKAAKNKLLFVGDGINDAPVLIRADIGFAMGGIGSDAAIESADVVIMNDEPSKVELSIRLAKKTKAIVMQNIVFCLAVKLLVMLFTIFGNVTMPLAVFADVGVALIAVLNASRILKMKFN